MTSVITAFSSEDYLEGKEAEKLIKSGIIQETIELNNLHTYQN